MKTLGILLTSIALTGVLVATTPAAEKNETSEYPLTTCIVSGEELAEMDETFVYQHEGREVRLCCKKCLKKFLSDPDKYLAKLDAAAKARAEGKQDDAGKAEPHPHEHHHE